MMSLQERFVAALDDLDLPDTDVAALVLADLGGIGLDGADRPTRSRQPVRVGTRRTLLAMAAALVIIVCIAAVAPARDAVARWFGIGSTKIEIVPPAATGTNVPSTDETGTTTARPTTSASVPATTLTGPEINPSSALDSPVAVVDDAAGLGRTYMWSATTELPSLGDTDIGLMFSVRLVTADLDLKRVGNDVGVEFVTIDRPGGSVVGLWIDGTHELVAAGTNRAVIAERVLLWEFDGIQYRLESELDKNDAVALAASMSGGTDLLRPG